MNLEGLQELLKEIEKVGMDHIDEEKFTGLLLDFTDKNCTKFDQGATDGEIDAMMKNFEMKDFQKKVPMFLKKLFLLLMIQDPDMCTELSVDKIIIGHGNTKIFVLRRLIRKADFLTQIEREIFVEKLYVAGREAFCHGDGLIKYQNFIISNEEFERFSINKNAWYNHKIFTLVHGR